MSLNLPASAGAQITVAMQSNPNISATFQETVLGSLTSMTKISGDGQSAQTGTTFARQLVVQVNNASGPVQGYPVQYIVTGPVTLLEGTTIVTNANGQAAVTPKAGTLTGTATVTAVAGALTQTFTLTITSTPTAPPPNGMTIVSGNSQSALVNATFAQPLVVQVNSTAGPVSGYVVNFSATGTVSLFNRRRHHRQQRSGCDYGVGWRRGGCSHRHRFHQRILANLQPDGPAARPQHQPFQFPERRQPPGGRPLAMQPGNHQCPRVNA